MERQGSLGANTTYTWAADLGTLFKHYLQCGMHTILLANVRCTQLHLEVY